MENAQEKVDMVNGMAALPKNTYKPMQVPPHFWFLLNRRKLAQSTETNTVTLIDVLNEITEREARRDGLTVADLVELSQKQAKP